MSITAVARPGRAAMRPASATGDRVLRGLCTVAGLIVVATLGGILIKVVGQADPAINRFGLSFLTNVDWQPNFNVLGAGTMLYGTFVTSALALVLAAPLGIAIALYLALLAPRRVAAVVGPLVEMLAAVPSVIAGFWGLVVLAPWVHTNLEPFLHRTLGFLPIFGPAQTTGLSLFTSGLVLAFMILPIIASLSRDLFLTVPRELREGAEALGATRWEVIRGVVLPTTAPGVSASIVLALGRGLGEAIAVAQLCGFGSRIHASVFVTGQTLAARVANDITSVDNSLHQSGIFYLALILLAIGLITNLIARLITRRLSVGVFAI